MQGLYYVFFVTFVPYQQQHETTQRIFVLASLYTVREKGGGRNVRNVQSMICKALSERFQTVKMPNWVCVPIWRVGTVEIKLMDTSKKILEFV